MENKYAKFIFGSLFLLLLIATPARACERRWNLRSGFDEYGYNEHATLFKGCLTNYYNWKFNGPAIECSETDMKVFAKWRFDREDHLRSLFNVLYEPTTCKRTARWKNSLGNCGKGVLRQDKPRDV